MKDLSIASAEKTSRLLQELHVIPNKSKGQNFLISGQVVQKIEQAARIKEDGRVLEIGPGLGALSEALAQSAASLCLIELDGRLCLHLRKLFADEKQVEIINADALSFDYAAYAASKGWPDYQVVANLPYCITSQIIRYLLLAGGPWQSLTLMMQKEVADKLSATQVATGGPLAVLLHYFGTVRLAFTVPPDSFMPPPDIHSAVLHVERHMQPPFAISNLSAFEFFLQAAFRLRRKTLINSLRSALGGSRELWQQAFEACAIPENYRAEQLSVPEFGTLFNLPQVQELLK